MSGFERFDPRTWTEGGVTRNAAVAAVQSVSRAVRRASKHLVAQTLIVVTASFAGSALSFADTSIQTTSEQTLIARSGSALTTSDGRAGSVDVSFAGSKMSGELSRLSVAEPIERAQDARPGFLPDRSVLRSGTFEKFGTARERFRNRQPVQMSASTRLLAEKVMAQRDAGNSETGSEWAERLMKNMYS